MKSIKFRLYLEWTCLCLLLDDLAKGRIHSYQRKVHS